MITYNFICIDLNNELRRLTSNEGATYDFPMIIGSSGNTEIYSFSYAESEGKIKVIAFHCIIDKFYACGKFDTSTVNTYGSSSFTIKLDSKMRVEKLKCISTNFGSSTDGRGMHCEIYGSNIFGFMVTDTLRVILTQIDIPNMATITGYGILISGHDSATVSSQIRPYIFV